MKFLKSQYGFQNSIFTEIKKKTGNMSHQDIHGIHVWVFMSNNLLIYNLKLEICVLNKILFSHRTHGCYISRYAISGWNEADQDIAFNKENLKLEARTNLGKHTPESQKGKADVHALVLIFQPFRGKWVQTLGCSLSRGSASGNTLQKLLIECIILCENAGLRVDAITTDGATWNRSIWRMFGLTEIAVSAPHIVDANRRLRFISDFPHLIKCVRNFFIKHGQLEGIGVNELNVKEKKRNSFSDLNKLSH